MQFVTVKLHAPAVVAAIRFGKYFKPHVCNLKEFKVRHHHRLALSLTHSLALSLTLLPYLNYGAVFAIELCTHTNTCAGFVCVCRCTVA